MLNPIGPSFGESRISRRDGVRLNEADRNLLWGRLSVALKMNNAATHRKLRGDEIPNEAKLASMSYYPMVTGTDYGGANAPSYKGFFDGKDLYLQETTRLGGLENPEVVWHILPGFSMPPQSAPDYW